MYLSLCAAKTFTSSFLLRSQKINASPASWFTNTSHKKCPCIVFCLSVCLCVCVHVFLCILYLSFCAPEQVRSSAHSRGESCTVAPSSGRRPGSRSSAAVGCQLGAAAADGPLKTPPPPSRGVLSCSLLILSLQVPFISSSLFLPRALKHPRHHHLFSEKDFIRKIFFIWGRV